MTTGEHQAYPIDDDPPSQGRPSVELTGIQIDARRMFRSADPVMRADVQEEGFALRDLLYTLFRHKFKIVGCFIIATIGTAGFVARQPHTFLSEAHILVKDTRGDFLFDPSAEGDSFLEASRSGTRTYEEIAIMQAEELFREVVSTVGAERILVPPEELLQIEAEAKARSETAPDGAPSNAERRDGLIIDTMRKSKQWVGKQLNLSSLDITLDELALRTAMYGFEAAPLIDKSNVISLSYMSHTPEIAQEVLQAFVDAYMLRHIRVHESEVKPEFFGARAEEKKRELEAKEAELEGRQKELNISSLETEKELKLGRISALEERVAESEVQIVSQQAQRASVLLQISERAENIELNLIERPPSPEMQAIRTEIIRLKMELASESMRYQPGTPPVEMLEDQIASSEAMLAELEEAPAELSQSIDPIGRQLEIERDRIEFQIAGFTATAEIYEAQIGRLHEELAKLMGHSKEIEVLQRDVLLLQDSYRQYINSRQSVEISQELDRDNIANVKLLQPATKPIESGKSRIKMLAILVMGSFGGLVMGLGLAFGLDYFDHSVRTVDDLEAALGMPVLASFPLIEGHKPEPREEAA